MSFLFSTPSSHTHTHSLTPLSFRLISSHTLALTQPALPRSCHPQLSINLPEPYFCHINNSVYRCVRERGACSGSSGKRVFFLSRSTPARLRCNYETTHVTEKKGSERLIAAFYLGKVVRTADGNVMPLCHVFSTLTSLTGSME